MNSETGNELESLSSKVQSLCRQTDYKGEEWIFLCINPKTEESTCIGSEIGKSYMEERTLIAEDFYQHCREIYLESNSIDVSENCEVQPSLVQNKDKLKDQSPNQDDMQCLADENDINQMSQNVTTYDPEKNLPSDKPAWQPVYFVCEVKQEVASDSEERVTPEQSQKQELEITCIIDREQNIETDSSFGNNENNSDTSFQQNKIISQRQSHDHSPAEMGNQLNSIFEREADKMCVRAVRNETCALQSSDDDLQTTAVADHMKTTVQEECYSHSPAELGEQLNSVMEREADKICVGADRNETCALQSSEDDLHTSAVDRMKTTVQEECSSHSTAELEKQLNSVMEREADKICVGAVRNEACALQSTDNDLQTTAVADHMKTTVQEECNSEILNDNFSCNQEHTAYNEHTIHNKDIIKGTEEAVLVSENSKLSESDVHDISVLSRINLPTDGLSELYQDILVHKSNGQDGKEIEGDDSHLENSCESNGSSGSIENMDICQKQANNDGREFGIFSDISSVSTEAIGQISASNTEEINHIEEVQVVSSSTDVAIPFSNVEAMLKPDSSSDIVIPSSIDVALPAREFFSDVAMPSSSDIAIEKMSDISIDDGDKLEQNCKRQRESDESPTYSQANTQNMEKFMFSRTSVPTMKDCYVVLNSLLEIDSHDNKKILKYCDISNQNFQSKRRSNLHMQTHDIGVECDIHKKHLSSKDHLEHHCRSHHIQTDKPSDQDKVSSLQCKICLKVYSRACMLDKHMKDVHQNKTKINTGILNVENPALIIGFRNYLCQICNKPFHNFGLLRIHLVRMHSSSLSEEVLKNLQLKKKNPQHPTVMSQHPTVMSQHPTVMSRFKTKKCKYCPRKFKCASLLKKHQEHCVNKQLENMTQDKKIISVHDTGMCKDLLTGKNGNSTRKANKCRVCKKMFSSPIELRRHRLMFHSGDRKYQCTVCKKCYKSAGSLYDHKYTHVIDQYSCEVCGKTFKVMRRFRAHVKNFHPEIKYGCKNCHVLFSLRLDLEKHKCPKEEQAAGKPQAKVCKNKLYKCKLCVKTFTSELRLRNHRIIHRIKDKDGMYFCSYCIKGFKRKEHCIEHERIHTGEKPIPCKLCGMMFMKHSQRSIHYRLKHGKNAQGLKNTLKPGLQKIAPGVKNSAKLEPYRVVKEESKSVKASLKPEQKAIEKGEKSVKTSLKSGPKTVMKEGKSILICKICGKGFSDHWKLRIHERVHTGERPYGCKICGKHFKQQSHLRNHERLHIRGTIFVCKYCKRVFRQKTSLIEHEKLHHSETSPFAGNSDNKHFQNKDNLIHHERLHSKSSTHLVHHEISHTSAPSFSCKFCGKKFKSRLFFINHERIHTGEINEIERPFLCTFCDKTFKKKSHLIEHTTLHTGEKLFHCNLCGKAFRTYSHAHRHGLSVHKKSKKAVTSLIVKSSHKPSILSNESEQDLKNQTEAPFTCEQCGKGFTRKYNLDEHKTIHTGVKPFHCNICGKNFRKNSNLTVHRKIHQKDNIK